MYLLDSNVLSELCAPLHVPDPKGRRDSMIAATALAHGFILATRNTCDFERVVGLHWVNPWEFEIAP
ncbi:MAG: hypothetical protein LBF16_01330 [Pseudomonadales bacterium]|jgi:predicted nucleic acid-binding protein|nr:hypothetical protein [Pseudomonadales bacterium]